MTPSKEDLLRLVAPVQRHRDAVAHASMEVDGMFGALGDVLGELMRDDSAVACQADELRSFVRDKAALVRAYQLFKKSIDLVEANIERADDIERGLLGVSERLSGTAKRRKELAKSVQTFWILATSIRIEAPKLPDGQSDEILHLVTGMDQVYGKLKVIFEQQFDGLDEIGHLLRDIIRNIRDARAANLQHVKNAWLQIHKLLATLEPALDSVHQFCTSSAAQTAESASSFREIVVALQYQDIVRQKLEQVVTACDQILRTEDGAEVASHLSLTHHVATIQAAQLERALNEIGKARSAIAVNSGRLMVVSQLTLRVTKGLQARVLNALRATDVAAKFTAIIGGLHDTLSTTASLGEGVRGAVTGARTRVLEQGRAMVGFTSELRRIALNAQVHSARVTGGRALEALAAETTNNSDSTREATNLFLEDVGAIVPLLEEVRAILDDVLELSNRERDTLHHEAERVQSQLEHMVSKTSAQFAAAEGDLGVLRSKLSLTVSEAKLSTSVLDALHVAQTAFVDLAEDTAPWALAGAADPALQARLDKLRAQYVMQDQRSVHDTSVGRLGGLTAPKQEAPVGAASSGGAAESSEFGANVDLF
jgi:hypothetical protein